MSLDEAFFKKSQDFAEIMISDIFESASPFHAIKTMSGRLSEAGFKEIKESEEWSLEAGEKYWFTRNGSSIVSFVVGKNCATEPVESFKAVGTHTDSPCIRMAPIAYKPRYGYE